MWWLIPVGVGVALKAIYDAVSEEEREARQRWEETRGRVERSVWEHQRSVESHLAQARHSYNFQVLVDAHYSSMKAADTAYKLLDDARSSEKGINKMLKEETNQRTILRERLKKSKAKKFILFKKMREKKNKASIRDIELQLKGIREMRKNLFDDRDKVKAQKESFLNEVRVLNNRTRKLKELIRDECGSKGRDWFNRLEARKRRKRL